MAPDGNRSHARSSLLFRKQPHQFCDRIKVTIDNAFFQRNDGVVGNVNVFGAYFRTAFGDITESDSSLLFDQIDTIVGIQRMHFQSSQADKEPRSGKIFLVLLVIANDVTDVLA